MLLWGSAECELHDEVILKFGLTNDIHFALRLGEDSEVGFVVLVVVFGKQPLKIFNNGLGVLPELNVELLDFLDPAEVHVIAPELKIKLKLAIAGELDTNKPEILGVALDSNFDEQILRTG